MKIHYYCFSLLLFAISSCTNNSNNEKEQTAPKTDTVILSNSIYNLDAAWTDQNNKKVFLKDYKGEIQVVAMVFTHCAYACPRIVNDMQAIEAQIPISKKDKVHFLLISFDTERDSIQRLNQFHKEMKLNENWTLLHGNEDQVRNLSVLLNVQFEKQQDGNFSHSNIITILDTDGIIQFQQEGLEVESKQVLDIINNLSK